MEELKEMIESRKDQVCELEAEIRILRRVQEFVIGIEGILPDVVVRLDYPLPDRIDIQIDLLASPQVVNSTVENIGQDASIDVQNTSEPSPTVPAPKRRCKPKFQAGPWSENEIDELISLKLKGKTPTEIAPLISRDVKAVANKLYRIKDQIEAAEREAQDLPEDAPSPEPKPEPTPPVSPEAASPASPALGDDAGPSSLVSSSPAQPTSNGVRIRKRNGMAQDFCKAAIADHLIWVYAVDKAEDEQFWAPDLDLQLITILARGDGIPGAVAELGRIEGAPDRGGFVDRFQMLLPHATVDNQKFTLELLKERVAA